jgi:hypothetical protein
MSKLSVDRIVGDFGQGIRFIFEGVSLQDSTITIHALKPNRQTVVWTILPANVDAVLNTAVYVLTATDLDVKGPWQLQGWVDKTTLPLKRTKTIPVLFEVGESL